VGPGLSFIDDVLALFDGTELDVADEIDVDDGRFCVAIVTSGDGSSEGEFGRLPVRSGQTFALPASVPFLVRAGTSPVRVVRCMGPLP
jgi:mannose-6-phosphate isomerase class I